MFFVCFFVKYVFYFTGGVDNINILLMLSPLMNYKYCSLHSWNKTYLTKTFEYPLCMTEEKQIYILVWLSKTDIHMWLTEAIWYTYMYGLGLACTHICMTEEKQKYTRVWLREIVIFTFTAHKSGYTYLYDSEKADIPTCMTQEKQIYLLVWLRKSRYTYLYDSGKNRYT